MLHRTPRILFALLALSALAGGAAWAWQRGAETATEITRPKRGPAIEAVYATGTVEPESWARISPVTSGRIAEILAREGEKVREGQPLARLDDREARARISELEAKAAYWREEKARAETLADSGIRARESAQKARSEYEQAQATIAQARQRRADLLVTSPIDGIVLRRDGEIGELAETKDALFWVGAPRPLRITAEVDEEDIARVRVGQRVLIKADAFPDQVLEGVVDRLTPKGDPVNKTFRVRVRLPDDTPLLIGMTCEINVIIDQRADALLIPATALVDGRVLVVRDTGRVEARQPRIGIRGRTQLEVLDGLDPDQPVVAAPPPGLKPGDAVRAK